MTLPDQRHRFFEGLDVPEPHANKEQPLPVRGAAIRSGNEEVMPDSVLHDEHRCLGDAAQPRGMTLTEAHHSTEPIEQ